MLIKFFKNSDYKKVFKNFFLFYLFFLTCLVVETDIV